MIKTQDYLEVFARFKQTENIEAVERVLGAKTELELFEKSQLGRTNFRRGRLLHAADPCPGSLCCETAEEAKTLIPSLASKISDDDLQDLLNDITQFRNLVID